MSENIYNNSNRRHSIIRTIFKQLIFHQCPANSEYSRNSGSLAAVYSISQSISGLLLSSWYIPSVSLASQSIDFMMREIKFGWLLRYIHANGASFFSIALYLHIGRNIFFGSYSQPREKVWISGMLVFSLTIFAAFSGHVSPWGQMSYWAATVISNLIPVSPLSGELLPVYAWGGIIINQPTLTRIYGLHFLIPFIILSSVIVHVFFLYEFGSNNSFGTKLTDTIPSHPYHVRKDIYGIIIFFFIFAYLVLEIPNKLNHSDNYILANPMNTPIHIVPERYPLPSYGLSRSIPNKTGGVLCSIVASSSPSSMPYSTTTISIRSGYFRPFSQPFYFSFILTCSLLGRSGGKPIENPYYIICQSSTFYYFAYFSVFNPLIIFGEYYLYLYLLRR